MCELLGTILGDSLHVTVVDFAYTDAPIMQNMNEDTVHRVDACAT